MQLVTIENLETHIDDRGSLTELIRCDDEDFESWGQTYLVGSFKAGTIRGLHKHKVLVDDFTIIKGSAKFRFFKEIELGEGTDNFTWATQEVVASDKKLIRIHVPAGVFHGWMSLEDDTILISTASVPYCGIGRREAADEERIPYNHFDAQFGGWEVKFK